MARYNNHNKLTWHPDLVQNLESSYGQTGELPLSMRRRGHPDMKRTSSEDDIGPFVELDPIHLIFRLDVRGDFTPLLDQSKPHPFGPDVLVMTAGPIPVPSAVLMQHVIVPRHHQRGVGRRRLERIPNHDPPLGPIVIILPIFHEGRDGDIGRAFEAVVVEGVGGRPNVGA